MKIGYDAKRMLNNPTGLGNHARILLNALMRDFPDYDYSLFSPRAKDVFLTQLHGHFKVYFPEGNLAQAIQPLWRSYGITKALIKDRVDIYHGISNELPFNIHRSGIASVVTIHDLIFLKHRAQYPWLDRQFYKAKTQYAARKADAIIAVSKETKRDLIDFYKVPERKITVIYPSIDPRFYTKVNDTDIAAIAARYNLPQKYILNVSSFFPRKNQINLINAFSRIKDVVSQDLVLIGSAGGMLSALQQLIVDQGIGDRVYIITGAANDDLPAIFQSADLFVFPSLFEGFGAPVLEALASGVPVIASGGGAIEEAAGEHSLFIDPQSVEAIADQMLRALNNKSLHQTMVSEGYAHAQTMTDAIFAARTMDVYRNI